MNYMSEVDAMRREESKKFREELLDKVVRRFGHEHPATIAFATICENYDIPDETIAFFADMNPVVVEEED